jgi:hypothetical protein
MTKDPTWSGRLPEYECCVPSLEMDEVPPMAVIPSLLLIIFRKVLLISLLFNSCISWNGIEGKWRLEQTIIKKCDDTKDIYLDLPI